MDEERYQKELFKFEEPKRHFPKLVKMLPKPDLEGKVAVTLTLDKIVFIFIGIVMIMVMVYAIGVESGKSRAVRAPAVTAQAAAAPAANAVIPAAAKQLAPVSQKSFLNTAPAVASGKAPEVKAAAAAIATAPAAVKADAGLYTIVAAAFTKKETAQAGAALLTKEGNSAFVYYSDPYYLVSVGSYADKSGTRVQRDLVKIKRVYKDAYVKQR